MIAREATAVLLLISVLFLPFWLSLVIAIAGMFLFSLFFEAAFMFLISDLLFGVRESKLLEITFATLIFSLILLLVVEIVKKKLRFYPKKSN